MLAFSNIDVFQLMNGLMQRYPKDKVPEVFYGLSMFMATGNKREHAIVLDAAVVFRGVEPPPTFGTVDGVINWEAVDKYVDSKRPPVYVVKRVDIISKIIEDASRNDNHALSAMLSNFTSAVRPSVKIKVVEFLLDPKSTKFSLPPDLQPKRGRAVGYYETAVQADYTELKAEIRKDRTSMFAANYWKKIIATEAKKASKP